jgi:DNA-binding transcriptional ArsR family regulator
VIHGREVRQYALAEIGALLAEASRVTMLLTLGNGGECTAGELARAANISPQTASFHLKKLASVNLVVCAARGKNRYFRAAGAEVAELLDCLLAVSQMASARRLASNPHDSPRDSLRNAEQPRLR